MKRNKLKAIVVSFLFLIHFYSSSCFAISNECEALLSKQETSDFMSYLGQLLDLQIIGEKELLRLRDDLTQGRLRNPIYGKEARINSALLIHQSEIEEYIEKANLNKLNILVWVEKKLYDRLKIFEKREESKKETSSHHNRIAFYPLPSSRLDTGQMFEAMSTPVTQKQWIDLMGKNPSRFQISLDHPVERVNWFSAIVFANKLSLQNGLAPAYKVSNMYWKPGTSPSLGNADIKMGQVLIEINAPDGDIRHAEGYRLPTKKEQTYLLMGGKKSSNTFYFGNNTKDLEHHAWYVKNSEGTTHPVAELKPLLVDGHAFYDLHGNVWELSDDWCDENSKNRGHISTHRKIMSGGSWDSDDFQTSAAMENNVPANYPGDSVGFRLVRTIDMDKY